jgi:hypothetical protein
MPRVGETLVWGNKDKKTNLHHNIKIFLTFSWKTSHIPLNQRNKIRFTLLL